MAEKSKRRRRYYRKRKRSREDVRDRRLFGEETEEDIDRRIKKKKRNWEYYIQRTQKQANGKQRKVGDDVDPKDEEIEKLK